MAREKRHSVKFCGVKLVRWDRRPRRAVKVYRGWWLMALCPNGAVAIDADSMFDYFNGVDRDGYCNRRLASDLHTLGALSDAALKAHSKLCDAKDAAKERSEAADKLQDAAKALGIKLTKQQRATLARASGGNP